MKLNVPRTALVGLAFMAICAFWQLYDNDVQMILKNTYGLGETATGVVMAMDNIVALLLLPLFGAWSDRHGRRIPFILIGSVAASALALVLPYVVSLGNQAAVKGEGLGLFLFVLALLLIAMGTFRSPTVALMPDVTPRHLRSKGNAIINLMGAIGGALILLMTNFLVRKVTNGVGEQVSDYTLLFVAAAVMMTGAALVVKMVIPEDRLKAEADEINARMALDKAPEEAPRTDRKLSSAEMRSLLLILASVFLWFMAYNAVSSAFNRYAQEVWGIEEGPAANCLLVATVAAIISYWPVGVLASKYGRKRVILLGVAVMAVSFLVATMQTQLSAVAYILFALVGIGWASINVNSYPMVVELATGSDVGKYTGYYYTFSMAAQVLTPVLSGALLEHVGYWTLFPYSTVMAAGALATMFFVKHGDSKPEAKRGLEALDVED